jgi:hypothetical protein
MAQKTDGAQPSTKEPTRATPKNSVMVRRGPSGTQVAHHVNGDDGRAETVKIDQDIAEGQDPEDQPPVSKGFGW